MRTLTGALTRTALCPSFLVGFQKNESQPGLEGPRKNHLLFWKDIAELAPYTHGRARPWPKSPPTPTAVREIAPYTHGSVRPWPKSPPTPTGSRKHTPLANKKELDIQALTQPRAPYVTNLAGRRERAQGS